MITTNTLCAFLQGEDLERKGIGMDLELATNLIFKSGFLWPTGPPEQAPKSSWRATAFKLCGDAVAASAAAIDSPRGGLCA